MGENTHTWEVKMTDKIGKEKMKKESIRDHWQINFDNNFWLP